jgi:predicted Rossmann-fold nucleotide-binding protein
MADPSPFRRALYSPDELLGLFTADDLHSYARTLDFRLFQNYVRNGRVRVSSYSESVAETLHDNSISRCLVNYLKNRPVAAIMGGHQLSRLDPTYAQVASMAYQLAGKGFLVASGGGPGAMEASHVGAYFAGQPRLKLDEAVAELGAVPRLPKKLDELVADDGAVNWPLIEELHAWQLPAFTICRRAPGADSLAVPTWNYGHEPPSPFGTKIAKYYQNSIREEGLLALASHGIIYVAGSAGTLQEVFQDNTQNFYSGASSSIRHFRPMVFFGRKFWLHEVPAVRLLRAFYHSVGAVETFKQHVLVTDSPERAVRFIAAYRPGESGERVVNLKTGATKGHRLAR